MQAQIISVGTELLLGRIIDTDAAFVSRELAAIGIDVRRRLTVGDNVERLTAALRDALQSADIVITTGGLGPTIDDITIETIARLTGSKLVLNKTVLKKLKAYFKLRRVTPPPGNIRQAYVPKGARLIQNTVGTAPGLIVEYHSKLIVCLPGPPRELEPMVTKNVMPFLRKRYAATGVLYTRTVHLASIAESAVNWRVKDLLAFKPPVTVGIYAKMGQVDLVIMAKTDRARKAQRQIGRIERIIKKRLGNQIFGYDDETLESATAAVLFKKRITVATAESCTAGLLAHRLTAISGSSKFFPMGVVTYANTAKARMLGISEALLSRYGAVSKEVALSMAYAIRYLAKTDIGIAITGIAGPTGGTKTKPVGLVYIALATKKKRIVKEVRFRGSRDEVRFQATQVALNLIRTNA